MTSIQRIKEYCELGSEDDLLKDQESQITEGKIELDGVWMKYREDLDYVLKDLTFSIQPQMKVGIVGRTGAGKSSIL